MDVSKAIWKLQLLYMPRYTEADLAHNAKLFWEWWNFPNCCGSVDSKHIVIQKPPCSHMYFRNYKHTFSINLMAVVDPMYKLISVDVGSCGVNNNLTVFKDSAFGKQFLAGNIKLPDFKSLPGMTDLHTPHVLLGDEAFPCRENVMWPFSRSKGYRGKLLTKSMKIFNCRHSCARLTIECTFGILDA